MGVPTEGELMRKAAIAILLIVFGTAGKFMMSMTQYNAKIKCVYISVIGMEWNMMLSVV